MYLQVEFLALRVLKVKLKEESHAISEWESVGKITKVVEHLEHRMDATSTDMVASTSSSIAKPEKFYFDELPKEMHEMKIKEDKMENKVYFNSS